MRAGGVILILVLVVLVFGGVAEYRFNWPFALWQDQPVSPYGGPQAAQSGAYVARYSNVRGLQDAPRDDVAQGGEIDMQHCLNTMNLRGLTPPVAQHTCEAIIAGISR